MMRGAVLGVVLAAMAVACGEPKTTIVWLDEEPGVTKDRSATLPTAPPPRGPATGGGSLGSGTSSGGTSTDGGTSGTGTSSGGNTGSVPLPACGNPGVFDPLAFEAELGSPYKSPGAAQLACTSADAAQLTANLQNVQTFGDLKQGLSAACTACVFTTTADARWGPIVTLAADPALGFLNQGACFAIHGGGTACGRAVQLDQFCANSACGDCAEPDRTDCLNAVWGPGGECKAMRDAIPAACPQLATALNVCDGTFASAVKTVCGP